MGFEDLNERFLEARPVEVAPRESTRVEGIIDSAAIVVVSIAGLIGVGAAVMVEKVHNRKSIQD